MAHLQVIIIILTGERHSRSVLHLLPVYLQKLLVYLGSRGRKSRGGDKFLIGLVGTKRMTA
jgi:hypothetical protein